MAGLRTSQASRTLLLALVIFTLLFRLLTLMNIHTGVDERDYWRGAKALVTSESFPEVQHRTVRWSILVPVAAIQLVFGTHPNVYYVAPLLLSAAIAVLLYFAGRRLDGGHLTGFLAALGFVLFPYMIRGGSQIRPGIFSLFYLLGALLLLLRRMDAEDTGSVSLLPIGALLFLAYLSKITNVYVFPAFLIALWLLQKDRRGALLLAGGLFGLFLVETAAYWVFLGEPLGRLGIIAGNHLASGYIEPMGFLDIFRRYSPERFPIYWSLPSLLVVPAWWFGRRFAVSGSAAAARRSTRRIDTLALFVLWFFLGITFAVSSLDPVVPVEAFHHRYFLAALGPILLIDAYFVAGLAAKALGALVARLEARPALTYPGILALAILGVAAVFASGMLPASLERYYTSPTRLSEHPVALNSRYLATLSGAYADHTPIVARPGVAGDNALKTVTAYFFDHRYLPQGRAMEPATAELLGSQFAYLIAEPADPTTPVLLAERNPFRLEKTMMAVALALMAQPENFDPE